MSKNKKTLQTLDRPIYAYWQAWFKSFYSRQLYIDVAKRWRGFGLMYLFTILLIACLPLTIRIAADFQSFFDAQIFSPISKLPPVYIQNGEASLDMSMPYVIRNQNNEVVLIADTRVKTVEILKYLDQYPTLNLFITKDRFYFRLSKPRFFFNRTEPIPGRYFYVEPLPSGDNEVLVAKDLIASTGVSNVLFLAKLLIYCLILSLFTSIYVVLTLTLALLGQVFAQTLLNSRIPYKTSCRLFAVASTPQMVIFFILFTSNLMFQGIGFIFLALFAIYYFYAVLSVKSDQTKLVMT